MTAVVLALLALAVAVLALAVTLAGARSERWTEAANRLGWRITAVDNRLRAVEAHEPPPLAPDSPLQPVGAVRERRILEGPAGAVSEAAPTMEVPAVMDNATSSRGTE